MDFAILETNKLRFDLEGTRSVGPCPGLSRVRFYEC